jgi:2-aminoethylphosphonate-pyruvate transaminase
MDKKIKRKILLNPGPATTTDTVKMAQVVSDICPRENEFSELVVTIQEALINLASNNKNNFTCILFGGSGTASMEAVISSVITNDSCILIINNGAYGERMVQIAKLYKLKFIEYKSASNSLLNLKEIEEILIKKKFISHVAVVHHETTTGLLNDISSIGKLCKLYSAEFIVDAISSFGATNIIMEESEIDYLISTSNKNLQGMAGIGIVIAKLESLRKISNYTGKNLYLNLYNQYKNFQKTKQFQFTPPVQILYSLKQAIKELNKETLKGRYLRYSKSWETLVNGMDDLGFKQYVPIQIQSKFICSFIEPDNFDFDDFHDFLYERDITIYPGKVLNKNTFRIGTIGEIDHRDIDYLLECVTLYLKKDPK